MASYGYPQGNNDPSYNPSNNLNFYQSSYAAAPVPSQSTPFGAFGNAGGSSQSTAYSQGPAFGGASSNYGFGAFPGAAGVSGSMGTGQGGLRTGWLAAFGTEGYEGEPPLLEELGVNFEHIRFKVSCTAGGIV